MNRMWESLPPLIVIGAVLAVALGKLAAEQWAIYRLPAPVLAAVAAQFPGAFKAHVENRLDRGRPVYDLALRQNAVAVAVRVTADGNILRVENAIDFRTLPDAVRARLKACCPKGRIRAVRAVHDEALGDLYRVEVALPNGGMREVVCDDLGRLTRGDEAGTPNHPRPAL